MQCCNSQLLTDVLSIRRVLCDFWWYLQNFEVNFAAAAAHSPGIVLPFLDPAIFTYNVHAADYFVWVGIVGLAAIIVEGSLKPSNNVACVGHSTRPHHG